MVRSKTKAMPTGDYEVGYCRPPQAHRFRQGEVHNRRGRPRRSLTLDESIAKVLAEPIVIHFGGEQRTVTKAEAVIHKLFQLMPKSARATRLVIKELQAIDRERIVEEVRPRHGVVRLPPEALEEYDRVFAKVMESDSDCDPFEARDLALDAAEALKERLEKERRRGGSGR